MDSLENGTDSECEWQKCAKWLTRCGALRADHKANWVKATAFDLAYTLRDGVLLCNLLNALDPGCLDIKAINQKPQLAQFLCLRNIKIFLSTCSSYFGLLQSDLFEPAMLFDLSDFRRVLCTLSALSTCDRLRRKCIKGFSINSDESQEDIYKYLQSAGAGREDAVRRRRSGRRVSHKPEVEGESGDPVEEECYRVFCSQAQSEEVYQYLCVHQPASPTAPQRINLPGGEKRDFAIRDLHETEQNYGEVLNSLLKDFARPLSSVLRTEDSACIFFKISDMAEIHIGFRKHLRKARSGTALGRVFLNWKDKFLIYRDYCANLNVAQTTLRDVCARNELVKQELLKLEQGANDGKFGLSDILAVPMQRVLKYHLLLEELVEETPSNWGNDRLFLETARDAMLDVAQYVHEVICDSNTLDIISDIQASIVGWDFPGEVQLKDFGRLLKDGELRVRAHGFQRVKVRYVFVFEQAVLVCKAGRGDQYHYKEILRLDDYRLEDFTEMDTLRRLTMGLGPLRRGTFGKDLYQWLLVQKRACTAYTLYARTEEQKQSWMNAFRDAMDNVNPVACQATNHKFRLTTFDTARCCTHCGKFLKGRIFQGYKCETCHLTMHKQCIMYSEECRTTSTPLQPPPIPSEDALSMKLWFVGEMGREAAKLKLKDEVDGTYMLRVRPAGQPRLEHETNYALSVKANKEVKHIEVFQSLLDGVTHYYLSKSRIFKNLVELVEYYEKTSLVEHFERLDQRLLWPLGRVRAKTLSDIRWGEYN